MLDKIEFLISEAFKAFRRNGLMAFAAISTVAISLFLLGGLSYAYFRITNYAEEKLPKQFTMEVFLNKGTTQEQIKQTIDQIRQIPGVKSAILVPKEKAYPKLLQDMQLPAIPEEKEIPIADKFVVGLTDLSEDTASAVRDQIQVLPAVSQNGIRYLAAEQRFVDQLLKLLRVLGTLIGGLLFSTAGILIYNAIRLTIMSRRLEIRVMQLVGASRFTIKVPFVFEGIIQGLVGGALAGAILLGTHQLLVQALVGYEAFGQLPPFPLWPILGTLSAIGALYGCFSSMLALSAPLRYR